MRTIILIAGATVALAACGGGETETNQVDLSVNNLVVENLESANALMNGDANAMGLDANAQNAVTQDLTTNDVDTNLANGL